MSTRGRIAAEQMTQFINSARPKDMQDFCDAMGREQHRTLQQKFMGLCMAWVEYCARVEYLTDLRNQQTKILAQAIVKNVEDRHLPLI